MEPVGDCPRASALERLNLEINFRTPLVAIPRRPVSWPIADTARLSSLERDQRRLGNTVLLPGHASQMTHPIIHA